MAVAISMSAEQFHYAVELITAGKIDGVELTVVDNEAGTGHIHTSQIDADYEYVVEANTLKFTNEVKHGMTKMISDETIGEHLSKLLASFPVPEPPAESNENPAASPVSTNPEPEKAGS